MKAFLYFVSFFLLILGYICNDHVPQDGTTLNLALPQIRQEIDVDLKKFENDAVQFEEIISASDLNTAFGDREIAAYKKLRSSFKTIEFIIEYWDKQFYEQRMNGAPLPKLTQKDTSIRILQPKGLQVMDEIIYGEFTDSSKSKLLTLIQTFNDDIQQFKKAFHSNRVTQRHIFEALRYNVIRQATLSITGFDTPGSLLGVEECLVNVQSNQKYLTFFKDEMYAQNHQSLFMELMQYLDKGEDLLQNVKNFDDFNRLKFIKEFTNPVYKTIKQVHLSLNYETWNETADNFNHSLDYNGENLFGKTFLDAFSFVSQQEDSLYDERVKLGRLLFYDPILSNNNRMACVSCHHPDRAFSDGLAKSLASDETQHLQRNALALPYSVYAQKMFWDVRVEGLENQFEHVITNDLEFHTAYAEIVNKLKQSNEYQELFKKAYKSENAITTNAIDYALTAYIMTLGDFNTPFDQYMQGKASLSQDVKEGFNLFAGKAACATCHFIPTFSGLVPPFYTESESEVLGVTTTEEEPWVLDEDLGRYNGRIKEGADFYKNSMKTVTVRNVEKTGPYMHNGAFGSLETVMDFYNDGGGAGRGLDVPHQTLSAEPLNLTNDEIEKIIAFMKSLNDTNLPKAPQNNELPRDFNQASWNQRSIPLPE